MDGWWIDDRMRLLTRDDEWIIGLHLCTSFPHHLPTAKFFFFIKFFFILGLGFQAPGPIGASGLGGSKFHDAELRCSY